MHMLFLLRYFLQWPSGLSPRIIALARRVTAGLDTPYDKALAIRDFLRRNIKYSLQPPKGNAAPLVDFLFNRKQGPCEFFATAMVIMTRVVGVPARLATGFYGGTSSSKDGFIDLHASDAHAWAEVFFPRIGFIIMDPTPPSVIAARSGNRVGDWFSRVITTVKLWWYHWVVKYNLKKQAALLLKMLSRKPVDTNPYAMATRFRTMLRNAARSAPGIAAKAGMAIIVLAFLLVVVLLLRRHKKRWGRAYFRRAERMLARRGPARTPYQTPRDLERDVCARFSNACESFGELVDLYYQDLFGPGLARIQRERIKRLLKEMDRKIR